MAEYQDSRQRHSNYQGPKFVAPLTRVTLRFKMHSYLMSTNHLAAGTVRGMPERGCWC